MDSWIIILMLGVSVFLGGLALFGIMWAIKSGQFDDKEKFLKFYDFFTDSGGFGRTVGVVAFATSQGECE